jgi:hypothetical protein
MYECMNAVVKPSIHVAKLRTLGEFITRAALNSKRHAFLSTMRPRVQSKKVTIHTCSLLTRCTAFFNLIQLFRYVNHNNDNIVMQHHTLLDCDRSDHGRIIRRYAVSVAEILHSAEDSSLIEVSLPLHLSCPIFFGKLRGLGS